MIVIIACVLAALLSGPACGEESPAPAADLESPLPTNDKVSPRISLIGAAGTRVSIVVEVDGRPICEIKGKLDEEVHRAYEESLLMADGVCHGDLIPTAGEHEYAVTGKVILPDGKTVDVLLRERSDVTDVFEPCIRIEADGSVALQLAVG